MSIPMKAVKQSLPVGCLVKELRLRDINTIEDANAYVLIFMEEFNTKFGKEPRNPKDMHRPLSEHDSLDGSMCHKAKRTLSGSLTLRYDKVLFILEPSFCDQSYSPESNGLRLS